MGFKLWGWLSGPREATPGLARLPRREPESPYHAVSIRPAPQCCAAAKQLGKLRFLARKAPLLPLPECTSSTCDCTYVHYADRRTGSDRRRLVGQVPPVGNRRSHRGRRSTDAIIWEGPLTG